MIRTLESFNVRYINECWQVGQWPTAIVAIWLRSPHSAKKVKMKACKNIRITFQDDTINKLCHRLSTKNTTKFNIPNV